MPFSVSYSTEQLWAPLLCYTYTIEAVNTLIDEVSSAYGNGIIWCGFRRGVVGSTYTRTWPYIFDTFSGDEENNYFRGSIIKR